MNETWQLVLWAAFAGGLGSVVRYLLDRAVSARIRARFSWGIMLINLTGSFALGTVTGIVLDHTLIATAAVGFLGGYTTFSTASYDTVRLLEARRRMAALANGIGMLVMGVVLAGLGVLLGRLVAG